MHNKLEYRQIVELTSRPLTVCARNWSGHVTPQASQLQMIHAWSVTNLLSPHGIVTEVCIVRSNRRIFVIRRSTLGVFPAEPTDTIQRFNENAKLLGSYLINQNTVPIERQRDMAAKDLAGNIVCDQYTRIVSTRVFVDLKTIRPDSRNP